MGLQRVGVVRRCMPGSLTLSKPTAAGGLIAGPRAPRRVSLPVPCALRLGHHFLRGPPWLSPATRAQPWAGNHLPALMRPVRAATTARKSTSSTSSWRPTTRRSQWPTPDRHYRHRRPSHPARVPRLGRRPVDLPVRSRSDRPAGPRQPGVHRPRALAPADSCGRDRSAMVPQPGRRRVARLSPPRPPQLNRQGVGCRGTPPRQPAPGSRRRDRALRLRRGSRSLRASAADGRDDR